MSAAGGDYLHELTSGTDDVVEVGGYVEVESGADFHRTSVEAFGAAWRPLDALLERIGPPAHADREPKVDVWVAYGLRKRWRVVSLGHTYGEWDELAAAVTFVDLLVDGNPDLRRLR